MFTLIKRFINRKHACPMDNFAGSIEFIQFTNSEGVITMETPRNCLTHLKLDDYTGPKYANSDNRTVWLNKDEQEVLAKHHHTKVFVPLAPRF